jgi:hypothetical protein
VPGVMPTPPGVRVVQSSTVGVCPWSELAAWATGRLTGAEGNPNG